MFRDHENQLHILFAAKDQTDSNFYYGPNHGICRADWPTPILSFISKRKNSKKRIHIRTLILSGPFIPLTGTMGYIPLFGDLTEKIHVISGNVLHSIFIGEYDDILVDLTSIANIEETGLHKFLIHILKTIHLINGNKVQLIGANPRIAKISIKRISVSMSISSRPCDNLKNYYQ